MSDILRDFDKKNEIPKVKLNLPKFDFSHLTEAVRNMNSAFENITKDIRDRQDNAIAMEFTKCIGELLRKNGVVPKMTEYTRNFETDKTFEIRYGVSIDELDFSEHDKVFEDKIDELDRMRKVWLDKAVEWQQENEKLKQRIAELESKETEKPTKCTAVIVAKEINGQTYVTLDDFMSVVNDLQAEIGT